MSKEIRDKIEALRKQLHACYEQFQCVKARRAQSLSKQIAELQSEYEGKKIHFTGGRYGNR
jgi:uncharacterized coiled-coil DUF342 family protein